MRYYIETQRTAHHEAFHAVMACYEGGPKAVRYVQADGGEGLCAYKPGLSIESQRRITKAPMHGLNASHGFRTPGYSGDREQYLELLRLSGNKGRDEYDLLASPDAQSDDLAIDDMRTYFSPLIQKLALAIARCGQLTGDTVEAYYCNYLREHPHLQRS